MTLYDKSNKPIPLIDLVALWTPELREHYLDNEWLQDNQETFEKGVKKFVEKVKEKYGIEDWKADKWIRRLFYVKEHREPDGSVWWSYWVPLWAQDPEILRAFDRYEREQKKAGKESKDDDKDDKDFSFTVVTSTKK